MRYHAHFGIDAGDGLEGALDLVLADTVLGVDDLALQIGKIDAIVVDDIDRAHPGGGQIHEGGRAEPAGADDQHACAQQLRLAVLADLVEDEVAGVALELAVGESHRSAPPSSFETGAPRPPQDEDQRTVPTASS